MSGGKSPRRKGDRSERELVELLREMGYSARRIPQSGSAVDFKGDVLVGDRCGSPTCVAGVNNYPVRDNCYNCKGTGIEPGSEEQWEVKRRAGAFKLIDRWLDEAHAVAFRRDRGEWCVCLRLKDLPKP